MVNAKTAGIIAAIIVVIAALVFGLSTTNLDPTPQTEENDQVPSGMEETPEITESVGVTKNSPDFYIDEEGNKKYVVSTSDEGEISEG